MKNGLDAMPLFFLDDLLRDQILLANPYLFTCELEFPKKELQNKYVQMFKKAVSKFAFQNKKNYIPFNSFTYESSCWRTIAIILRLKSANVQGCGGF